MGEFSAGKSTLTNILLDSAPLPMRVTATRLPPVEITHGAPAAFAVGMDGTRRPLEMDKLEEVSLDDTLLIQIRMEADALQLCDIVDMPGISDPSMPKEIWNGVIEANDRVIWCTHATQAWRQSEAAIWEDLRGQTSGENLLLITQFDKLRSERDQDRVLKRLRHETDGLFEAVYPVSLLQALKAGDDYAAWEKSGAAAVSEHIIRILMDAQGAPAPAPEDASGVTANDIRDTAALRAHAEEQRIARENAVPVRPRRIATPGGGAGLRQSDAAELSQAVGG
jgi:hypothetical protein